MLRHTTSTTYYPQGNGQAESTNKVIVKMLQKLVNDNRTDWDIQLYTVLFSYRTAYKVATGHSPFELVYGPLPLMLTKYIVPTQRTTTDLDITQHRVLAARTTDLDKLYETRLKAQTHQGQAQWNHAQWVQTQGKPHQFRMGDYVLWYPNGANVYAGKLQNKWYGPYRVQYLLPNNIVLLVIVDKFDLDPVIVNIKKLKTYRCPEEGLPDLSSSDHQTKTQLIEASFQNEDEPTGDVGTHPVIVVSVTQPVPNPKTVPHLDTSLMKQSHPQPQGGNLLSISTSLLFQMARVNTRAPYQSRPRTITTPEAAAILSSFTIFHLSHLHPSNSPMSAQRVVRVTPTERPSTEWRGRLRRRHGSKRPSVLSGSKMSLRENRAYFYYRRRTRMLHSVSWAEMAPKLTRPVPSPKTHSPMAQAAARMYMTYHYQAHTYIAQWREQARSDPVERAYIEKMGLGPFVNMNWADPNSAPRMRLIEEFINGAVHHPDRIEAEVNGKTCVINMAHITRFLHLLIGNAAEILAKLELDRRRLIEYQGLEPKQPGNYSITQGHQGHILCKRVFIQTFMFKRKPTYISENAIQQWVSAEILASKGKMWGWALCMFRELVKEVKECKKGRTTICVSAEVLNRILDLHFPHSTHPTQKVAVQRKDDLRRAKENEKNQFNGPNYLILRRSPVHIVDEASPSSRTEPVFDTMDPLPTQEPAVQPTRGPQTSQPDKGSHPHPRDRAKEIATSQLKK